MSKPTSAAAGGGGPHLRRGVTSGCRVEQAVGGGWETKIGDCGGEDWVQGGALRFEKVQLSLGQAVAAGCSVGARRGVCGRGGRGA